MSATPPILVFVARTIYSKYGRFIGATGVTAGTIGGSPVALPFLSIYLGYTFLTLYKEVSPLSLINSSFSLLQGCNEYFMKQYHSKDPPLNSRSYNPFKTRFLTEDGSILISCFV